MIIFIFRKHDATLPPFLRRLTCASSFVRLLTDVTEAYQKFKDYEKAVELFNKLLKQSVYLQDFRGLWFDRLALITDVYMKDYKKVKYFPEPLSTDIIYYKV